MWKVLLERALACTQYLALSCAVRRQWGKMRPVSPPPTPPDVARKDLSDGGRSQWAILENHWKWENLRVAPCYYVVGSVRDYVCCLPCVGSSRILIKLGKFQNELHNRSVCNPLWGFCSFSSTAWLLSVIRYLSPVWLKILQKYSAHVWLYLHSYWAVFYLYMLARNHL